MSNYLAVATVTAALQRLLQQSVPVDMPGATVTTVRPGSNRVAAALAVNIYLYQVSTSTSRTNEDLPTHRADGSLAQRPRAHLDLHYLLSFHGDDTEMEPERLLGSTVRTLNARPVLNRDLLNQVAQSATATPPMHPGLAATDLATAGDVVRLRPESLDLEQLSKLWSVLLQTPYALSTTYVASSVAIEGTEVPRPVLPVLTPEVAVVESAEPQIERVGNALGDLAPILATSTIRVSGAHLGGRESIVTVAGVDLAPTAAGATYVDVDLTQAPPNSLRPGRLPVTVTRRILTGSPPGYAALATSDPVLMPLHPTVTSATFANGAVTVQADLAVGPDQTLAMRFFDTSGLPILLVSVGPPPAPAQSVTAAVPGLTKGQYAVALLVDGADSPLNRSASGTIAGPLVSVP
ncbi:MAG TPA: DUF4255 domain-containing protein [Actinomycetota bacterium]|nr:DUF4255 domain-containing protein [Actinomycetota bacterium]